MAELQHDQSQHQYGLWGYDSVVAHLVHVKPASSREQINRHKKKKKFQRAATEQAKAWEKATEKQTVSRASC